MLLKTFHKKIKNEVKNMYQIYVIYFHIGLQKYPSFLQHHLKDQKREEAVGVVD